MKSYWLERRPVLLTLLSLTLLLVLASGAVAQDVDMGVPLDPSVSGDVEFWHFWGSPVRRTAIQRIVGMCEQALPNINVTEVFKPWGDIWTANTAAVAAGSGMPDVIVEDRPQLARIAAEGIEQNLQPFIEADGLEMADRFFPFTWEQTLYEGDSYGIPFETDVRVLFYNKDLFRQAGLDPENPPETWEELEAAADQLDVISEGGDIERMGFFPLHGVGWDIWAQSAGLDLIQDGRPVVDDPAMEEALTWVQEWIDRYGGWENVQEFFANYSAPPNTAFMLGDLAMYVSIAGDSSFLRFYDPRITLEDGTTKRLDWGVALIPKDERFTSSSGGFALSIPTGADNPEAAWEFIKCATSPVAQASWARDTYSMPSDLEAVRDPALMADPNWRFFVEAMEVSEAHPLVTAYPNWREQMDQRLEQVWRGELDPAVAIAEAQQAIDEVIAQNQ